ncbi:MAG: rRNA pseudouridine synthase [Leptolyngbyaceae cyanobacterium SL_5_9]|nr:rRNA pseudouridine synthase [Leptolyngbyaceae cyanobacterium SL_5_9]NJO74240.1 rRNA pseudouridine synthase [Leptolyngbyaceae cyanobacterium RM1_406_9]
MDERLQKILAQWGVASRRGAEQMILEGRVRLNGYAVQLGQKADPERDWIEVDGKLLQPESRPQLIYLLLHKPAGVVTTCNDPQNRETVLDLLPSQFRQDYKVYPVGRLDADSTGALLLTNDGNVTFCLTHPRHSVPKTYHVWVQGHPSESVLEAWRQGVILADRLTLPAEVRVLDLNKEAQTLLEIVLREGRNRQIRRVATQLGFPVLQLHRVAIGSIYLQQLPSGQYRPLQDTEIDFLQTQADQFQPELPNPIAVGR